MKTKTKKLELSVVIPVLNEEQNIKELAYEIDKALKNFSHEIIFVDDGSKDDTRNSVLALNNLKQVRLIVHKKCYGQSIAMRSGILKSNCNLIATLDGDGQNDPSDLPAMIKAYFKSNSKLTLVAGIRYKRKDTLSKKIASIFARYIRRILFSDTHPDSGCGIRVFSKELYSSLPFFNHMHRFFTILALRYNADVIGVNVNHRERVKGKSKYSNLGRAMVGIIDVLGVLWVLKRTPKDITFFEETK
jgi:dolichol-phosphate mannosyltransferase|tara:strand:- start:507 stop:1244 length:738 start_codon:yes stop_codon:yes gene_type:complete